MIRINQIKIRNNGIKALDREELGCALKRNTAKVLRIDEEKIEKIEIIRHSIDARKKPEIYDIYLIDVTLKGIDEKKVVAKCKDKNVSLSDPVRYDFKKQVETIIEKTGDLERVESKDAQIKNKKEDNTGNREPGTGLNSDDRSVVIIGAGPAGLFCAYMLAENGYKPIVFERGADVDKRTEIVERFWKTGELNTETNVQFGEGGAGTFSDGKLNTMVKDKDGRGRAALQIFVDNGAKEDILYDAKPHIGTDILRNVVKNMREHIISLGGEVHFESVVTELLLDDKNTLTGVKVLSCNSDDNVEKVVSCKKAVLAIGHSARDTFYMLKDLGVDMEKKPFAVGFRVEHPQSVINLSHYGIAEPSSLPPAPYKLTTTVDNGRGVYSFCMCPGGYVVNASSEPGRLAVNGMSYSARDGKNANSAIIITVDPKDFGSEDVLSGVEFQRRLEEKAFELGGGKIPVEYYGDFKAAITKMSSDTQTAEKSTQSFDKELVNTNEMKTQKSFETIAPCMRGEYVFGNVHEILPDELNTCFVQGMEKFGRMIKGYNNDKALVSGVESRTSSPVRINRGQSLESVNIKGLYPCGEGAGYAGGIMSAAMDGMKVAEYVAADIGVIK